jgi:hypothetical protein
MVFCTGLTILTLIGPRRAWLVNRAIATPYMLVFLLFPVIYYLTHPEDYYRRPIDRQYVVLAAAQSHHGLRNGNKSCRCSRRRLRSQ